MNVSGKARFGPALAAISLTLALCLGALPALAGTVIPSGSQLNAVLATPDINTKNAQVGDAFSMNVVPPFPNGDANLAGAVIRGHVESVTSAGQGRKAKLKLAFDSIVFSNGASQPVSGTVTSMASKSENTTARKGIGAAAGAAVGSQTIGRIIGGSAGSVIGLLGGAAGGFAYANNAKANFNLAKGAAVTIVTSQAVSAPHRQAGQ